jgi:Rap1a immunity proteins
MPAWILAIALIAVLVVGSWPACAANLFVSGDQARELCRQSQEWCVGFVTGALDGWAALEAYYTGDTFCLPADLTTGRIVEIFLEALEGRAEPRDEPGAYVLYERLIELYPCK